MKAVTPGRRAVIYGRYSSDLQSDRSIEDQVALCQAFAGRQGYTITKVYSDRARSGASVFGRDGLLALLEASRERAFDVLVVEALDRLSRDQEDLAAIFKRLQFLGIEIVAVHDGRADAVQIGIRGLVGSLFLTDLANKVRRGMTGRVKDGLSAGGKAYGYRPVLGKPGELEIVEEEAAVVRRIFAEYGAGRSCRDIAEGLNRDRVAPPRGAAWNASTINGSVSRENGLLRNPIYGGRLVWNRVRMVRDPDTGKRVSRPNPESEWKRAEVPDLRLVDEATLAAVSARLERLKGRKEGERGPRSKRLLSGLLRCGSCGSGMPLDGKTDGVAYIRCSRAKESRSCEHSRKYPVEVVEATVLEALERQLADPEALALYVETYVAERRRLAAEATKNRGRIEGEIAKRRGEIDRILTLAIKGVMSIDDVAERKPILEAEVARLNAELEVAPPLLKSELHPAAIAAYRADITALAEAFRGKKGEIVEGSITEPLRRLVSAVVVHPTPTREPIDIEIVGRLSELLGEDAIPARRASGVGLVAEERCNSNPRAETLPIARFFAPLARAAPIVWAA